MQHKHTPLNEWVQDENTLYLLHDTGKRFKGEPLITNKFWFSMYPDYGSGGTKEDCTKEVSAFLVARNNHQKLIDALKEAHSFMLCLHTALDSKNFDRNKKQQELKNEMTSLLTLLHSLKTETE